MKESTNQEETNSWKNTVCPKCSGTGWIIFSDEEDRDCVRECDCGLRQSEIMNNKLTFADIPQAYKNMRLRDFRLSVYKNQKSVNIAKFACEAIKYWLDNLEWMEERGKGLYIYSITKGSGKTRMATSVANELIHKHNRQVKFATSVQIINEIKASWNNADSSEAKLLADLSNAPFLIIDDFGTEVPRDWIGDKFYSIINQRYVECKPTIITSNQSLDTLQYDERITNRIMEMCFQIPFPEESVRKYIADDMIKDLIDGRKNTE